MEWKKTVQRAASGSAGSGNTRGTWTVCDLEVRKVLLGDLAMMTRHSVLFPILANHETKPTLLLQFLVFSHFVMIARCGFAGCSVA